MRRHLKKKQDESCTAPLFLKTKKKLIKFSLNKKTISG